MCSTRVLCITVCAGGNQRELARQKNAKKQQSVAKSKGSGSQGGNKGTSLEQRRHRYANYQPGIVAVLAARVV